MITPFVKTYITEQIPVYIKKLAIEAEDSVLVYLNMFGTFDSLRASLAQLKRRTAHGKNINHSHVYIKRDEHIVIKSSRLPCGYYNWVMLHKQASLQAISPFNDWMYLFDVVRGGTAPLNFYELLNRAVAIPMRPTWAEYLWQTGKNAGLIDISDRECFNTTMASIQLNSDNWLTLITEGLANNDIAIKG